MTLSRKQREIAQRHELFLEIAENILDEEGFHLLSMERIAELAEYSKGTVYQHFCCKEEILFQLCSQELTQLLKLFEMASQIDGSNRDRITAIFYAHQLWSTTGKHKADLHQHLTMHGVKEKVTHESKQKHDNIHNDIIGIVHDVVTNAIASGEMEKHENLSATEIVYALWALSYGGQALQTPEMELENMGINNPSATLLRSLTVMLDGLNWQPAHSPSDFKKLINKLEIVFQPEVS